MKNLGNRYSQHSFAQVPQVNMARSKFDRSFAVKDTLDFDQLVPIFCDEILPGDTVNLNVRSFARLATQAVPMMDNMYMDYFFFFIPNRLVWDNWEKFNGAQDDPGDSTDYLIPTIDIDATQNTVGSIYDHFGIPTGINNISFNALPFRAYQLCWNDWFRDQNLQDSIVINKGDGPDDADNYTILKRAKKHDYFTSALPWPQKGASVTLPLGTSAPVYGSSSPDTETMMWQARQYSGGIDYTGRNFVSVGASNGEVITGWQPTSGTNAFGFSLAAKEQYTGTTPEGRDFTPPYADLTEATAATINQFRQAIMMQSLLELDARGGTRYVEILRAHFNVVSPDFRLQRPEFLSGGSTQINQHVVPQTSESGTTPQANLAAYSTTSGNSQNIGFTKSFVEHGYVIGLVQARADITYQQGLNRMWSRQTRWDFFWPKLQELGEQTILNKEIYTNGDSADDEVFGYQERYAEYRYKPSEIRGQFRSTFAESLDVWHLAEDFETRPALNATFIQSNTPIERALVTTEGYPHLLFDAWFDYKHARPVVTYGVPATLGRF